MVGAPQRAHVSAALLVLAIEELNLGPHAYQATSQVLPVAHGVEGQRFTNSLVVTTTTSNGEQRGRLLPPMLPLRAKIEKHHCAPSLGDTGRTEAYRAPAALIRRAASSAEITAVASSVSMAKRFVATVTRNRHFSRSSKALST